MNKNYVKKNNLGGNKPVEILFSNEIVFCGHP